MIHGAGIRCTERERERRSGGGKKASVALSLLFGVVHLCLALRRVCKSTSVGSTMSKSVALRGPER